MLFWMKLKLLLKKFRQDSFFCILYFLYLPYIPMKKAMVAKITEGVKVTVETNYQPEYSNPANAHFMFAYRVIIENLSDYTVQLLSRHWDIFDSNGTLREVEGEGVIGIQPI